MDNFFESLKTTAVNDVEFNSAVTENGAIGFATTGKALLDLNFAVSSLRNSSEEEIKDLFAKAYAENPKLAILWLFYARDVRGGLGERRLFRVCLNTVAETISQTKSKQLFIKFLEFVGEYGRWDDIFGLLSHEDSFIRCYTAKCIKYRLEADEVKMKKGANISLLAKWMPSENASSKNTKALAAKMMKVLKLSPTHYRKKLSKLRKYLDVTERKMSANKWSDINYEAVPSKAALNYKNAFLKHDEERYTDFINNVNRGDAKINAGVLYPHEIVAAYIDESFWTWTGASVKPLDSSLEALWKNLPDLVNGDEATLVVADGSGSMFSRCAKSSVRPIDVANALAIYFAERAAGPYKNKYITFSQNPKFVDFTKCQDLRSKIGEALKHNECANTDIEKVFDLVLKTAIKNKCRQEELPASILILSDMEFDEAHSGIIDRALFQEIADKYTTAGYKLPRLVFWNLYSRTKTIPVVQNDLGVVLISGYSVNLVKMVLSNEIDPYKCLVEQLVAERYAKLNRFLDKIFLNNN